MYMLMKNARAFRERAAARADEFGRLADGQSPQALFITCSDSRVVPSLITGARPGELFELRTAGNIVPAYDPDRPSGEAATIEYAVEVLGVADIVVCGHSHCGAVGALVRGDDLDRRPRRTRLAGAPPPARPDRRRHRADSDHVRGQRRGPASHVRRTSVSGCAPTRCVSQRLARRGRLPAARLVLRGRTPAPYATHRAGTALDARVADRRDARRTQLPSEPPPTCGSDFAASLVVFLVALPLCVGVAVASGVPAELGLVTGIVGGLVAGLPARQQPPGQRPRRRADRAGLRGGAGATACPRSA